MPHITVHHPLGNEAQMVFVYNKPKAWQDIWVFELNPDIEFIKNILNN